MQVLLECCYIWMESSWWENWNHLFCRNVSFLIASHCRWLAVGRWFSPSAPVSSTNITVRHYITEIYLKGVRHHNLNPILHTIYSGIFFFFDYVQPIIGLINLLVLVVNISKCCSISWLYQFEWQDSPGRYNELIDGTTVHLNMSENFKLWSG
jgi:hypothetical protein